MNAKRGMEIEAEVASKFVMMCGSTGVLKTVNNSKLKGDVKIRHRQALNECKSDDPRVQAIYARIYGLI